MVESNLHKENGERDGWWTKKSRGEQGKGGFFKVAYYFSC
jgi:hypothetical protein